MITPWQGDSKLKKWSLILLLALLLTGCDSQQATAPTPTQPPLSTEATLPADGLYSPGSALEKQTGGAVRLYPLDRERYDGILAMGQSLLLL